MRSLQYRPEIDGLRAIAVMSVVLFHTRIRFSGGYVGVDIFFVISGFLITSLILAELREGRFSLLEFYERRARRILPAATLTALVSLPIGYLLLLPSDFAEHGWSVVAQAAFVANVFFYGETGYFESPADAKPLLHTWSLSVEEQFYLIFPLLLLALFRQGPRVALVGIGLIAAASFAWSAYGVNRHPGATFYLLPSRAWELGVGALLALRNCRLPLPEWSRQPVGWLGLAMMTAPMILYDQRTPFPGPAALPPCLGAALVIWATDGRESLLKRLLTLRLAVFTGLISYSLYLWHWPVQIFTNYWLTTNPSPWALRLLVVGVSFGLAWLSWRFVETPFRARRAIAPRRRLALAAIGATGGVAALGALVARQEGLPGRFPPQATQYAAAYYDRPTVDEADVTAADVEADALPQIGAGAGAERSVLLWGDSHARVTSPGVQTACERLGLAGYRASRSSTAPILGHGNPGAREFNDAVLRWVRRHRPDVVLLVSRWEAHLHSEPDAEKLIRTIDALEASGTTVALMRQVPFQGQDVPKALARAHVFGRDALAVGIPVSAHRNMVGRADAVIDRAAAQRPSVCILDPLRFLAEDEFCFAGREGRALYYDDQHLTRFGASFLVPLFEPVFSGERRLLQRDHPELGARSRVRLGQHGG